jgi:hypothetical protein
MWKTLSENAVNILTVIILTSTIIGGSWTWITNEFVTKNVADERYNKLLIMVKENKEYSIISQLEIYDKIKEERDLSTLETIKVKKLSNELHRLYTKMDKLKE